MTPRSFLLIATSAAAVGFAWLAFERAPGDAPAATRAGLSEPAGSATGAQPSRAAVAPGGAGAPAARGPIAAIPSPRPPTLFGEFLKAKQYRALYDRLKSSAEGETAEGRYVLWEILRNCATVTDGKRNFYRPQVPKRDDFLAGLPANDPQREQRIAAFDEFTVNHCAGFEGVAITQAELDRALQASAASGDPRARALALEQDLWAQRRTQGRDNVVLTDASIDTLKQIVGTHDPEAIRVAGRVLANTWADTTLRIGPDQQPIEPHAFMNAWQVLACDYGLPCGADTPRMQQACALQGHCNAQTYPDYLYYYSASPFDSQMTAQYRAILRSVIDTGDWSQVTVVRGLPMPVGRMSFLPGPR